MARTLARTIKQLPPNILINGDMFHARWGTNLAINATNRFSCERWLTYRDTDAAGSTMSRQASGLPESPFCLRIQRDSGNNSALQISTGQNVESARAAKYRGKTMTISFLARCGANFSPLNSTLGVTWITSTGTDESFRIPMTGAVFTSNGYTVSTSWQRFTFQVSIPSNANQMALQFYMVPTGTAGASDYFEITQVSLQEGNVFNGFALSTENNQTELIECMRFYQNGFYDATGIAISATTCFLYFHLPVVFRATPTMRVIPGASLTNVIDETGTAPRTPSTIINESSQVNVIGMQAQGASGMTTYRFCRLTGFVVEAYAEMI